MTTRPTDKIAQIEASILTAVQHIVPGAERILIGRNGEHLIRFPDAIDVPVEARTTHTGRWSVTVGDYGDADRRSYQASRGSLPLSAIAAGAVVVAAARRARRDGEAAAKRINHRLGLSRDSGAYVEVRKDGALKVVVNVTGTPEQIEAVLRAAMACGMVVT